MLVATQHVLRDWFAGFRHWRFWWNFGLLDISLRYRRTYLGPFWLTISFTLSAIGLALVYSTLFKVEHRSYIAYLVSGLAVWGLVSSMITDGCTTLTRHASLIREHSLPLLAHAMRGVVSNTIIFGHNLVVVLGAILFFNDALNWKMLLALPALAILIINGAWLTILFGLICARFRDLPPLISVAINLLFLITPVFWYKEMLQSRSFIADYNPLFYFIDILRSPLLGEYPSLQTMTVIAVITVVGWSVTFIVAARMQPKLAYWV